MKVIDITPYFHSKSGGIKRYLLEKINFFEKHKINHILIIPSKKKKIYYLKKTKVYTVSSFPIPLSGGYRFFASLKDLKEIINMEKPQLIEFGGSYVFLPFFKSSRYKTIVFYHSDVKTHISLFPLPEKIKSWVPEMMLNSFLSHADLIITPSIKQEKFLRNYGFTKVRTVNLGVNEGIFNLDKRKDLNGKSSKRKVKIVYVGRISPEKNMNLILKLIEIANPEVFHFIIVGEGPLKKKFLKLSRERKNISYLEYIQNEEELAKIYGECDIYLSASKVETFGLSFLESQACGCILVAPDLQLETQPFKEFLIKNSTLEDFYNKLWEVKDQITPELRQRVSLHVRENFSWGKTFESLLKTYNEVMSLD